MHNFYAKCSLFILVNTFKDLLMDVNFVGGVKLSDYAHAYRDTGPAHNTLPFAVAGRPPVVRERSSSSARSLGTRAVFAKLSR